MTIQVRFTGSTVVLASSGEAKRSKVGKYQAIQRYEAQEWLTEKRINEQKSTYVEVLANANPPREVKAEMEKFIHNVHEPGWETLYTSKNSNTLGYLLKQHHAIFPGTRYRIVRKTIRLDENGKQIRQPHRHPYTNRNTTTIYAIS